VVGCGSLLRHVATYAFRNIRRTPLRSAFTVASVALVVMLYTVLASVGHSVSGELASALVRQQIDVVVQSRYAATPLASSLPRSLVEQLAAMPEVRSVEALAIGRVRLDEQVSAFVLGMPRFPEFAARLGLRLARGRLHRPGAAEMVLGERLASALGVAVGDALALGEHGRWRVVGVYSTWLDLLDAGIVVDLADSQALTGRGDRVNMLFLSLADPAAAPRLVERIAKTYPTLAATCSERLPELVAPLRTLLDFSRVVSGVTLLVVVAIMLNTLVMSIGERTSEIGILGAIGWPRALIVVALVLEALMLATAGALLGFGLAAPCMLLLQARFTSVLMYIPRWPHLPVLLDVWAMALLAGAASAIFPALHSTRMGLAAAIRHE